MMVPCVSCSSMFRLDNTHMKTNGSKVRCSKCHNIFKVYPPEHIKESCSKIITSNGDGAVAIPNVKHSLLDDLFQGDSNSSELATSAGKSEESDNSSIESIESVEDFEEVEEDDHTEYAELPDLSEIEEIVDSILDERDYVNNISPNIQAKYSLTQDLNYSGI